MIAGRRGGRERGKIGVKRSRARGRGRKRERDRKALRGGQRACVDRGRHSAGCAGLECRPVCGGGGLGEGGCRGLEQGGQSDGRGKRAEDQPAE